MTTPHNKASPTSAGDAAERERINAFHISYGVQDVVRERLFPWSAAASSATSTGGDREVVPHEFSQYWTDYARNFITSLPPPIVLPSSSSHDASSSSSSSSSSRSKSTTTTTNIPWPSINMITFFNARGTLSCATTSRLECRTVAAGFEDASVRVYSSKASSSANVGGGSTIITEEGGERNNGIGNLGNDEVLWGSNLFGKKSSLLVGHGGTVSGVSLWDEDRLLSCSQDGTVKFWALCERPRRNRGGREEGAEAAQTLAAGEEANATTTTSSSTTSGISSKDARISEAKRFKFHGAGWDAAEEEPANAEGGEEDGALEWQNVFTISSVGWWSSANSKYQGPIWDVKFAPFGYYFAVASEDGGIRMFSTERPDLKNLIRMFPAHAAAASAEKVAWHPNCHYVAGGYADGEVRTFDVRTGDVVRVFSGKHAGGSEGGISSLAFDPSGQRLASGGHDGRIAVWDLRMGRADELTPAFSSASVTRNRHHASVTALDWSLHEDLNSGFLLSGSTDCTVKIWGHFPPRGENDSEIKAEVVRTFKTKRTPICHLSFCRPDVAVCVGSYFSLDSNEVAI